MGKIKSRRGNSNPWPAHYECAVSGCWALQRLVDTAYYRGVYFATVSMNKKRADEGLQGESIAKRGNDYQRLVTEYNAAIQETLEAKGS